MTGETGPSRRVASRDSTLGMVLSMLAAMMFVFSGPIAYGCVVAYLTGPSDATVIAAAIIVCVWAAIAHLAAGAELRRGSFWCPEVTAWQNSVLRLTVFCTPVWYVALQLPLLWRPVSSAILLTMTIVMPPLCAAMGFAANYAFFRGRTVCAACAGCAACVACAA